MEQSNMAPPRLPPIDQGNRPMMDNNLKSSPLINFVERRSPHWRENHEFYVAHEDAGDMPREDLELSWSNNRAELWTNNYCPSESYVEDDGYYFKVTQSTQDRFGLPPPNKNMYQLHSRSKSIDQIPGTSYQSIYRSPSRYSTEADYGSIFSETGEWDVEDDQETSQHFRSLTPVEIDWKPPSETGELSPLSDTESDLARIYLPSLVPGEKRPRPLTPYPDIHREEHTEVTKFRYSWTPQQALRTEQNISEFDTMDDLSQHREMRRRKAAENKEKIEKANRGPKFQAEFFRSGQQMDAEDAKEMRLIAGYTVTEDSDQEMEYSYQGCENSEQNLKDYDQYFEEFDQQWEGLDQDCDQYSRDSVQDLKKADHNQLNDSNQGSKVVGLTLVTPGHEEEPDQNVNENGNNPGSLKEQVEETETSRESGMKSRIKSFFDSKFKTYSTVGRQASEDEAQAAEGNPEEASTRDGTSDLKEKQEPEVEHSDALQRELTAAWVKFEDEQNHYFKTMARVQEEQEIANLWRLDALQNRLSYVMLKAEVDSKRKEARTIGTPW